LIGAGRARKLIAMPTIVLVEDNEGVSELVRHKLRNADYAVACAFDGVAGLETVRRTRPDLVILDLMLPGMDGFDVLREIRADEQTRSTPVLMLTALGEEAQVSRAFGLGADDYMTKPFRPAELLARVQRLLDGERPNRRGAA
jgi:DNA-binding response OmpR family regulator